MRATTEQISLLSSPLIHVDQNWINIFKSTSGDVGAWAPNAGPRRRSFFNQNRPGRRWSCWYGMWPWHWPIAMTMVWPIEPWRAHRVNEPSGTANPLWDVVRWEALGVVKSSVVICAVVKWWSLYFSTPGHLVDISTFWYFQCVYWYISPRLQTSLFFYTFL